MSEENLCKSCMYFKKGFCEAMGEPIDEAVECDYYNKKVLK